MGSSFSAVEEKVREADFFLLRLAEATQFEYEANYYFSAFISASRSITFALQYSMEGVDGFEEWYSAAQTTLRGDRIASYFKDLRNEVVHKGKSELNRMSIAHWRDLVTDHLRGRSDPYFLVVRLGGDEEYRRVNAVELSQDYFRSILELVYHCYDRFRYVVAPRWYYTEENFRNRGLEITDALEAKGLPREWARYMPAGVDLWHLLRRDEPYCAVNDIFDRYLGKIVNEPD